MFDPRNIARNSLADILQEMCRGEAGTLFNVFRRFREVVLQRSDARQILIDYWMGHSNASMGDRYGRQLVEDIEYRAGLRTSATFVWATWATNCGKRSSRMNV